MYSRRSSGTGWLILVSLLAVVPLTLFNGWVLKVMWNWFVPNIFPGLPYLTTGTAIGLSLVITAFLHIPSKDDDDQEPWVTFFSTLLTLVFRGFLLLAMGSVVHGIVF